MRKFLYLLVALACMNAAMAQKKVAVYVTGSVNSNYKKVIGAKMVSAITRCEEYSAVERTSDFLAAMSQEANYQRSGAVNDSQIAALGQQFGVRYVAVVDVTELFEEFFIAARMIDVQTAKILMAVEKSGQVENMAALTNISESVASELITSLKYSDFMKGENIKAIGVTTSKELYNYKSLIPKDHHIATKEELEPLLKVVGFMFSYPIYCNLSTNIANKVGDSYWQYHVHFTKFISANESKEGTEWYAHPDLNISSLSGYIYVIRGN